MDAWLASDLASFDISPTSGFLPDPDPLRQLPDEFLAWEQIAGDLPKLLVAEQQRTALDGLSAIPTTPLHTQPQLERAMLLLSYFGHAYVWGSAKPATRLPQGLARPWFDVAQRLGRPPVLSYASYALHNWRRLNPRGPIALGNIVLLQAFLGGVDEEWFILVHVDIEARAATALAAIGPAQQGALLDQPTRVEEALVTIAATLRAMQSTLLRMTERCDPYIYFHRVRPYIHGWKDQPALPKGLVYAGVEALGGQPQQLRGETGAQSSIVPALDAVLGVAHEDDPLRAYLAEMRGYMPPRHRTFVAAVERGPSVRDYVLSRLERPALRSAYNECVHRLREFRATHFEYASRYVHQQAQRSAANPTDLGTGGTPFMQVLEEASRRNLRAPHPVTRRPTSSSHRLPQERDDPCLFGGSQLLQREGDRPHRAFVEIGLVAEAERRVPRVELPCTLKEADHLAFLGMRGHPIPGFRREGWRAGLDDRMEPRGHGAIRFRHRRDLRKHLAFPVHLVLLRARAALRFRLQLLGALLHCGSFFVRESLGRLVTPGGGPGGLLGILLWAHRTSSAGTMAPVN